MPRKRKINARSLVNLRGVVRAEHHSVNASVPSLRPAQPAQPMPQTRGATKKLEQRAHRYLFNEVHLPGFVTGKLARIEAAEFDQESARREKEAKECGYRLSHTGVGWSTDDESSEVHLLYNIMITIL